MQKTSFETIQFHKTKEHVVMTFLDIFKSDILHRELDELGEWNVVDKQLEYSFSDKKLDRLLDRHMEQLTNKLTGNNVLYVHENSGIPLIGNVAFGIAYRDSSIIEIKPVTSCNLDCVYCSISEGLSSKKNDFVVQREYLVNELFKLIEEVGETVEIHVGVQGEPFLYGDMDGLLEDLQAHELIHTISIDTNATLLTRTRVDKLSAITKLQLNVSLDAMDEEVAKKIAGIKHYNLPHLLDIISYGADKIKMIVAPVLTPGHNEKEIEKIIEWVQTLEHKPMLGIQNYLPYKTGRRAGKPYTWEEFYALIEGWEQKYNVRLKLSADDFDIRPLPPLEKPFKKGDIVGVKLVCEDRFPGSSLAKAKNRTISIPGCKYIPEKTLKVEIVRDKHNIYTGKVYNRK